MKKEEQIKYLVKIHSIRPRSYFLFGALNWVWFLLLMVLISFNSCIDEITFEPSERVQSQLVVDGNITTHPGPHVLKLSSTQNDKLSKPFPVTDAKITIFDDLGNSEDYLQLGFEPGVYHLLNEIVRGEVGRSYFIEITLRDGSVFRSEPEELRPVPKMTKIEASFAQETEFDITGLPQTSNFAKVIIDTPIPVIDEGVYLRWGVFGDWLLVDLEDRRDPFDFPTACYFQDNIVSPELEPFSSKEFAVTELTNLEVGKRIVNHTFEFKQYFSVFQYSLTPKAHTFYTQLTALSNIEGNLFDEPPAAIPSNIFNLNNPEEKVLGYFSASEVDTIRIPIVKGDVPFAFTELCPPFPFPPAGDPCYACESMEGASIEKPDFF